MKKVEEVLDKQFPKGECKERGHALVLFAEMDMAMEKYKEEVLGLIDEETKECSQIHKDIPDKFKTLETDKTNQSMRLEASISALNGVRDKLVIKDEDASVSKQKDI